MSNCCLTGRSIQILGDVFFLTLTWFSYCMMIMMKNSFCSLCILHNFKNMLSTLLRKQNRFAKPQPLRRSEATIDCRRTVKDFTQN